ncbi:MAG: serine hydrolase [Gemmatimonadota bacterium]
MRTIHVLVASSAFSLLTAVALPQAAWAQAAFAAERSATAGAAPRAVVVANDPTDAFVPGFTSWFVPSLDRAVEEEIADGATPGAWLVVGHGGDIVLTRGWGRLDWAADAASVRSTTVWDLASVTKVVATTLAVMTLVEEGTLDLDAPLHRYLPAWPEDGPRGRITLRLLLNHRSGLPAGAPFWRGLGASATLDQRVRALAGVDLEAAPGRREIYSDLGPILAGFAVEAVTGEPLDVYVERRIYRPLGLGQTTFRPLERGVPEEAIAPTERIGTQLLRGVVHDPSARALGGVAGNAGLFASAQDLAVLASALLWEEPTRIVCRDVLRAFTVRDHDRRRFGTGWEMPARWAVWSEMFSPEAFGHTGFTGTSFWIDPYNDLFVILLTNRVNPTATNEGHLRLRRIVHDVVRRGHLAREDELRAADWRSVDSWRGVDSCRAATGMELLRKLGHHVMLGWSVLVRE